MCTHTCINARTSVTAYTDVGGAYGGRWVSDDVHYKPRTRPPCWVRRGLHGVRTVLRTLSDLGGGVNGHDMNLHDKCGVCDGVTG